MLTFEKVLKVFNPLLDELEIEIVRARWGYIILFWFGKLEAYEEAIDFCATPEILKERLLGIYENALIYERTKGEREITKQDEIAVAPEVQRMEKLL